MSSEGLILATNDGELANLLTHPRYGVEKTYHVEVAGAIDRAELARLEEGMYLAEGFARVVGARIKTRFKKSTLLEITLDEGRNREIRRLLARTGHKVMRLRRIALGPLRLGEVPSGAVSPSDRRRSPCPAANDDARRSPRARGSAAPEAAGKAKIAGSWCNKSGDNEARTKVQRRLPARPAAHSAGQRKNETGRAVRSPRGERWGPAQSEPPRAEESVTVPLAARPRTRRREPRRAGHHRRRLVVVYAAAKLGGASEARKALAGFTPSEDRRGQTSARCANGRYRCDWRHDSNARASGGP